MSRSASSPKPRPCRNGIAVDFASAVVTGKAYPVTDEKEWREAFEAILTRHTPGNSQGRNNVQFKVRGPHAMVLKIEIEKITGKARSAAKSKKREKHQRSAGHGTFCMA